MTESDEWETRKFINFIIVIICKLVYAQLEGRLVTPPEVHGKTTLQQLLFLSTVTTLDSESSWGPSHKVKLALGDHFSNYQEEV